MTGGAAGFVGASSAFGTVGTTTPGRVVAHGVVGGAASEVSGGSFKSGFASSAFTKSVSSRIEGMTENNPLAGGIAASVVGGTASVLSGDKFSNAAMTTDFQYLFNEMSDIWNRKNVSTVIIRRESAGEIYSETIYGEWQTTDNNVPIPPIPQARGLSFMMDVYQGAIVDQYRINTTVQMQDYNLYEYDAVYDLDNGQTVNLQFKHSSGRFIRTIREEIPNTRREVREHRRCIRAITC